MALKLKEEFKMTFFMTNLLEDDMVVILELSMFVLNIRKQICDVLDGFFSFLTKYEKKNPWHAIFNVRPKILKS
jgi:hypothetical protein